MVNMLLEQGIDVEAQNFEGNAALCLAARDSLCIKVLLKYGADL
jgi:hypothetical protein